MVCRPNVLRRLYRLRTARAKHRGLLQGRLRMGRREGGWMGQTRDGLRARKAGGTVAGAREGGK
jgi:hypothetical protein